MSKVKCKSKLMSKNTFKVAVLTLSIFYFKHRDYSENVPKTICSKCNYVHDSNYMNMLYAWINVGNAINKYIQYNF